MTLISKKRVHSLSGIAKKSCGVEDPDVVHENVGIRLRPHERGATLGRAEIGGDAADRGPGDGLLQPCERGIDGGLLAAGDHDLRARRSEALGDGEADARGRAGHDGGPVGKVDLHELSLALRGSA
jgi:hypothetical protein